MWKYISETFPLASTGVGEKAYGRYPLEMTFLKDYLDLFMEIEVATAMPFHV